MHICPRKRLLFLKTFYFSLFNTFYFKKGMTNLIGILHDAIEKYLTLTHYQFKPCIQLLQKVYILEH